jgi:hypothetical protein
MKASARWPVWSRVLALRAVAVAVAVVAGLAIVVPGPAFASPARPAAAARLSARSPGGLAGVSCVRTRWCMAVGTSTGPGQLKALAWVWEAGAWHQLPDPPGPGLTGVSCTGRKFCMATGISGALLWDGTTWRAMSAQPRHAITAPSCGSAKLCAVINGTGFQGSGPLAETWQGQAWKSWKDTSFCDHQPSACGPIDVACGSAVNCAAAGYTSTVSGDTLPRVATWNGKGWQVSVPPGAAHSNVAITSAVSCAGTFCLAIGYVSRSHGLVANVVRYNATTAAWTQVSSSHLPWPQDCGGGCFQPGTLSCASSTRCMTAGLAGFFAWNGRGFAPAHPSSAGRGSKLSRVSCAGRFCMAVGHRTVSGSIKPLSELWNGKTWKILPMS